MIKVTKGMVKKFIKIMDEHGEFIFGDEEYIEKQLEVCLNSQGYWSGCSIRVYYDEDTKEFYTGSRF